MAELGLCCCAGFSLVLVHRLHIEVASHAAEHVAAAHGLSCDSQVLEHIIDSCGTWAYMLCSMWDLPRSEIKPASPA